MRRGRWVAVGVGTWAGLALCCPRDARACTPGTPPEALSRILPAGATMPANGWVAWSGSCGSSFAFEVTVDGVAAELTRADVGNAAELQSYRIVPAPAPGSRVEIRPRATAPSLAADCSLPGPFEVEVVEPDAAPPLPPAATLDVAADQRQAGGCREPRRTIDIIRFDVTVEPDPDEGTSTVLLLVELEGPDAAVIRTHPPVLLNAAGGPVEIGLEAPRQDVAAGEYCVNLRTFDTAGNEGDLVRACRNVDPEDAVSCSVGAWDPLRPGWAAAWLLWGAWSLHRRRSNRARS